MDLRETAGRILDFANEKLAEHPNYEEGMGFTGADVFANGLILPKYKTAEGESASVADPKHDDPQYPIYKEVWEACMVELQMDEVQEDA